MRFLCPVHALPGKATPSTFYPSSIIAAVYFSKPHILDDSPKCHLFLFIYVFIFSHIPLIWHGKEKKKNIPAFVETLWMCWTCQIFAQTVCLKTWCLALFTSVCLPKYQTRTRKNEERAVFSRGYDSGQAYLVTWVLFVHVPAQCRELLFNQVSVR